MRWPGRSGSGGVDRWFGWSKFSVVKEMARKCLVGPRLAVVVAVFTGAVLLLDARMGAAAGMAGQIALGAATWVLLIIALSAQSDVWRARTVVVIAVATIGELLGSVVLGLYSYRVGHIPGFVPPGHGLIFLAGCSLVEARAIRRHADHFVAAVALLAALWALFGVMRGGGSDLSGTLGVALFIAIVTAAPRDLRLYFAGICVAVSLLELAGTALGTWRWADTAPLVGLPAGNPPSGVASGYCLFDLVAFAVAPAILALSGGRRAATV